MGTPEYMSPEQLAGEPVDARSDLYSLALVAFTMLTGDLPFPAETTQTAMVMRLTEEPRSLAQMKPGVVWPPEVQAVMSKALDRNSSRRYANTRDFARALHAAIETMPAPASAVSSTRTIDGTPAPSSHGRQANLARADARGRRRHRRAGDHRRVAGACPRRGCNVAGARTRDHGVQRRTPRLLPWSVLSRRRKTLRPIRCRTSISRGWHARPSISIRPTRKR